ncbi:hypothetical protein [Reyranella sp.]|uniref:hypothetical protein n=1 Tax=Reyranella sp. TaxID=1929291 RepID=UPI003BACEF58
MAPDAAMTFPFLRLAFAAPALLSAAAALAQPADDRILYGTRAGMQLTTVSKSGIGTAHAVIRVEHTPQDAKAFCVEYVRDPSPACVRETLADVKIADRVSGDCVAKTWTDMFGGRFAFLGRAKTGSEVMADDAIRDLETGALLDGSPASDYDIELVIFRQLCPGLAK